MGSSLDVDQCYLFDMHVIYNFRCMHDGQSLFYLLKSYIYLYLCVYAVTCM